MSRYARERRTPYVRRKERVELSEGNIALRLLGVGVAILVAAVAFGTLVSNLLSVQTGWQTIEPANPETGIAQEFTLGYHIGASNRNATVELKAVSSLYSEAMDHGYRVLSNLELEHYPNVFTLNAQPNQELTVDALLYHAFAALQEQGSRYAYLAPVFEQYSSLFACTEDTAAEKFDPEFSRDVAEFIGKAASFANNPAMVSVELLGDNRVRLNVAQEYLDFALEYGVESFVDLGILRNAFLCDAAADALIAQGYDRGYLTSFDGFIRALGEDELTLAVQDVQDGIIHTLAEAGYSGPAAVAVCRSFPISPADQVNYYRYADGTIRAPYVSSDGTLKSAASELIAMGQGSVARLAIQTIAAYTRETLDSNSLDNLSWIAVENGQLTTHGQGFTMK